MPHPTRPGDLGYQELAEKAAGVMLNGGLVFVKWTCPDCGERVTSDKPLQLLPTTRQIIFPPGFIHTEREDGVVCERLVKINEHVFGMQVIWTTLKREDFL